MGGAVPKKAGLGELALERRLAADPAFAKRLATYQLRAALRLPVCDPAGPVSDRDAPEPLATSRWPRGRAAWCLACGATAPGDTAGWAWEHPSKRSIAGVCPGCRAAGVTIYRARRLRRSRRPAGA